MPRRPGRHCVRCWRPKIPIASAEPIIWRPQATQSWHGFADAQAIILNPAIETANHAKYANWKGFRKNSHFTHWVKCFGSAISRNDFLCSRGSRISRFIPSAESRIIDALNGGLVAETPLEITSIRKGNNGKPHLSIRGRANRTHVVEVSTNMVDWTPVGVATQCGDCDFEFEDAQSAAGGAHFYRVVSPK